MGYRAGGLGRLAAPLTVVFWAGATRADPAEINEADIGLAGRPTTDIHARSEPILIRKGGLEAVEHYCAFEAGAQKTRFFRCDG